MPDFVEFTNATDSETWDKRGTWSLGWSEIGLVQLYLLSSIFQKTHEHNYNIRYSVYHTNMIVPKRKQTVVKCGVLNEEILRGCRTDIIDLLYGAVMQFTSHDDKVVGYNID